MPLLLEPSNKRSRFLGADRLSCFRVPALSDARPSTIHSTKLPLNLYADSIRRTQAVAHLMGFPNDRRLMAHSYHWTNHIIPSAASQWKKLCLPQTVRRNKS